MVRPFHEWMSQETERLSKDFVDPYAKPKEPVYEDPAKHYAEHPEDTVDSYGIDGYEAPEYWDGDDNIDDWFDDLN